MKIAGIVTFNPNIQRLKENIDSIMVQADKVLIVDNASINIDDIERLIEPYENIIIFKYNKNKGIAEALNQIGSYALKHNCDWFLTLDQDSICYTDLIEKYEQEKEKNIAIMTCNIEDRNMGSLEVDCSSSYVDFCITSGSYVNTAIWHKLSGFDEVLFIDKVDTDYCYRSILNGYKIKRISYFGILHEVGTQSKRHRIAGKEFVVFNHAPIRCYYIVRNQIYFSRKHRKSLGFWGSIRYARTAWTRGIVYLLFEHNKIKKLKSWIKGIIDGYRMLAIYEGGDSANVS